MVNLQKHRTITRIKNGVEVIGGFCVFEQIATVKKIECLEILRAYDFSKNKRRMYARKSQKIKDACMA